MLSSTAAATPFMKTLRRSFMPAASPGSSPTISTGIPSGWTISANRARTVARGEGRRPTPCVGTGPEERHVHEPGARRVDDRCHLAT